MSDSDDDDAQAIGMSNGALYTIGGACAFFSLFMVYQASSGTMHSTTGGFLFGAVLAVAAVGCFAKGKLQGAALRAMGGVVVLACLGYAIGTFSEGKIVSSNDSDVSFMNALKALLFFGVPGFYLMIRGPLVFDLPGAIRGEPIRED